MSLEKRRNEFRVLFVLRITRLIGLFLPFLHLINIFTILGKLSEPLPEMCEALELGESGVYYLSEGNYARAKELFQRALDELKPILRDEPPSIRRKLLQHQVDFWNGLLIATDSHFTTTDIYTTLAVKSRELCVIQ
ncbi:uncharacterized protein LOC122523507 isoform X1 [Polistes fuscatus]|uniref:uncharacterized protein LOC122523507 isoform X1 n=1 Tax=Polistes fuscatus TaxID=30207 RepID=UPI001CAA2FBF|nr:uncharacterized protein LOC122523507 isoform X1 [Polistes fuscatus]